MEIEGRTVTDAEVEAAVRRYLARLARRYTPLAVGLVCLGVIVATVPTAGSGRKAATQVQGGPGPVPVAAGNPGSAPGSAGGAPPAPSGGGTGGPQGSAGARGAATRSGITPAAAAGSTGVARSGVGCAPGVRQVPWSKYAPPCVPAYQGNNGGATSYGVSGDAITLTFRRTNSAEEKAAFALAGSAAPGTDDQYLADLRSYVDLFNRSYELYGRHVVVKDYNGQGDNLQEDQGQNLGGAQADAATAHDLGAFMDISQSPTLAMTQPYAEDLAQEHVIAVGGLGLPKSWMRRYSPYEYSVTPDGNKGVTGAVNGLCARAVGMPAIFAGDPLYQQQTRAFGLVAPENPVYQELADQFENGMKACGANIAHRVSYSINVATEGQQATSIAAQMKTRGVTTVLCACDPIFEILISQNAWQQKYVPEWFVVAWLDPQGRQAEQNEWKHAISGEGTSPPKAQSEAYRVFKLANPKAEPQEKYFAVAYYTALYVFELLQLAGPNLNPLTVQHGAFAMPRSDLGDVGVWGGGPEAFDPVKSTQIGYWDPNVVSNFDGVAGGWISCETGRWFPLEDPSAYGPAHTQPHCFGR